MPSTDNTVTLRQDQRCQRCGAQALTLYRSETLGDFLLCAHHANEHNDALIAQGFQTIVDGRSHHGVRKSGPEKSPEPSRS